MTDRKTLSPSVELVFSLDDMGWYLHNFATEQTSQLYTNGEDAELAFDRNNIIWDD